MSPAEDEPATAARSSLLHRIGEAGANFGRRPPRSRAAQVVIGSVIAGLIFAFLLYTIVDQWAELQERTRGFEVVWLVPGLSLVAAFYVISGNGWDLLIRLLGHRVPAVRAQMVWGQSLLARYVPGSILFIVGRILLAEREGVPRRATLASFAYEIGLQFAAAALVGTWFFLNHPDLSGHPERFLALLVVPAVLAGFHPRIFGPLANRALERLGRSHLPSFLSFKGVIGMLAYYASMWCVLGVGLFFVARSVVDLELSEIGIVVSAQALAFCAAVLTVVTPGGLGVRDAAFAWVVKVAVGGSFVVGAAIAISARVAMTVVELTYVAVISALGRRAGLELDESATQEATDEFEAAAEQDQPATDGRSTP